MQPLRTSFQELLRAHLLRQWSSVGERILPAKLAVENRAFPFEGATSVGEGLRPTSYSNVFELVPWPFSRACIPIKFFEYLTIFSAIHYTPIFVRLPIFGKFIGGKIRDFINHKFSKVTFQFPRVMIAPQFTNKQNKSPQKYVPSKQPLGESVDRWRLHSAPPLFGRAQRGTEARAAYACLRVYRPSRIFAGSSSGLHNR